MSVKIENKSLISSISVFYLSLNDIEAKWFFFNSKVNVTIWEHISFSCDILEMEYAEFKRVSYFCEADILEKSLE